MSHRRTGRVLLCLAVLALAGCGIPIQSTAHVDSDKNVPSGLLDVSPPTTTSTAPADATTLVPVCLTRPDGVLGTVTRPLPSGPSPTAILADLATAPSTVELTDGLGTAVPPGLTAAVKAGIAKVNLPVVFASIDAHDQLSAVAQIVCTLTDQPGIGQLQFRLNGASADVPRGDGSTVSAPVSRDDYPQLMPAPGA